jgi:hypothetical protein
MTDPLFSEIKSLVVLLGLPDGFYENLLHEDDWSFVVKLNALFEGACTEVLSSCLGTSKITEALANLDFAHSKCGKIAMLKSLEAITSQQATFLRTLAELRNNLVHNISNVHFSFAEHMASRDENQKKSLIKALGHGIQDNVPIADKMVPRNLFVEENPKLALWLTAAEVLACLHLEFARTELRLASSDLDAYARIAHGGR